MKHRPNVVVLAGPNGAGKSTAAPAVLRGLLHVNDFVNADVIAKGLSGFAPEAAAMEAGRVMIHRIEQLGAARRDFALETTLAARTLAPRLRSLLDDGYAFRLFFFYLPSADLAVARVAKRVEMGGHNIPEPTIRVRYERRLRNFFSLYRPLATSWRMYDNSQEAGPQVIASGGAGMRDRIRHAERWQRLDGTYSTAE